MPPSSEGTGKGDLYAQDTTSCREIQSQPSPARSFQLEQSLVEGSFTLIPAVSGGLLPLLPMLEPGHRACHQNKGGTKTRARVPPQPQGLQQQLSWWRGGGAGRLCTPLGSAIRTAPLHLAALAYAHLHISCFLTAVSLS